MAYDGSLTFDTKIDSSGFNKGTSSLSKQANGFKNVLTSLGKTIAKVFAVTQLVKFGKQAVDLASDIQEVQNVVDTAFGDMKYKMEAFAETAIEMYGISKLTAKETGSTFMATADGMGLAKETASDMALQLTALSADMSSFYNKTQDITSTALKSVFTGETETLKQFGIVMTEANLEAFRLAQGIETSYKKMSQAEKVALRYNYVMQQTKLAQGDFAKTQNSWANQTRILSERWKEFLSILGSGLVKVLTPLVQVLNTVLQYLISFASTIGQLLGGEVQKQEAVSEAIGSSVESQNDLTEATKETAKANKKTLASFDEIQKLTASNEAGSDSASGSGVGFEVATPYNFDLDTKNVEAGVDRIKSKLNDLKKYFEQFKVPFSNWLEIDVPKLGNTVKTSFIKIFDGVKGTFSLIFTDLFNSTLPALFSTLGMYILPFFTQLLDQIVQTLTTGFEVLNGLFQNVWSTGIKPAIDLLVKIWDSAWQTIYGFWQKWGEPIFNNIRKAVEVTCEVLETIWNTVLQPIWQNFMDSIDWLWTNHLQPFLANFADFIGELINGALEIYNRFIAPVVKGLIETFLPAFTIVFNTVVNVLGSIIATITDILNAFITFLKGIIQFIVGVFTGDWEKAWEGVKNAFGGLWDGMVAIVKGAINIIIDFINGMIAALETALNWIVDKINSIEIVNPFTGEDIWSPNIPRFEFGRIPKLATGTVVPANYGEFAAILGDNKREAEVVSPLSTIKQALIEALAESGQNITINFEESSIGDLVRLLKPYIDKENRRIGSSTRVAGGAY